MKLEPVVLFYYIPRVNLLVAKLGNSITSFIGVHTTVEIYKNEITFDF